MREKFKEKYQEYLDGIYIINNPVNTASVLLFKEFLKRMRMWYERLNLTNKWFLIYRTDESFNLVKIIAPNLLNKVLSYNEFLEYSDVKLNDRWLNYPLIYAYLCWNVFKDYPEFDEFKDLPNPYEPVIKIFQRGNNVRRGEMKSIEIDGQAIFRDLDFSKDYLLYFNNQFLDYIDKKCKRLADSGIPNQEEVNILWEEYKKINSNG